jgi:hypothetical protein
MERTKHHLDSNHPQMSDPARSPPELAHFHSEQLPIPLPYANEALYTVQCISTTNLGFNVTKQGKSTYRPFL